MISLTYPTTGAVDADVAAAAAAAVAATVYCA